MALPTDINPFVQFAGGATADLGEPIGQSLRFNGLQANVLTRSQVATNLNGNKNFTFSTWFKLGDIEECCIFGCHHSSQENWLLRHVSTGKFDTRHIGNGVVNYDIDASVEIWKFFSKYNISGLINQTSKVNEFSEHKKLIKIIDIFGRETKGKKNEPIFHIYDDGTVEKKLIIE